MERIKNDLIPDWRALKAGRVLMPALLVVLVLAGCAPKRVIRGQTESTSSKPKPVEKVENPSIQGDQLPIPKGHGKVDNRPVHDPVQDLQLGIKAATLARSLLNKPYQWGAQGPEKFDCSGLVFYVYGSLDVSMPRVSKDQSKFGLLIKKSELQPGDLVFFITSGKDINHVGIYVGNSRFIHAPRRYNPVRYDSLNNAYWRRKFQFGRRISG